MVEWKERRKEEKKEKTVITSTVWESTFSILSRVNICLRTSKGEVGGRDHCTSPKSSLSPSSLTPNKRRTDVDGLRIRPTWW